MYFPDTLLTADFTVFADFGLRPGLRSTGVCISFFFFLFLVTYADLS